ncbi:MAG: hypothetical protein JW943_15950 [Deltaproteobacteria bacterium]|nr:hypothetical protein [Deltaproteobacteria bacterium]
MKKIVLFVSIFLFVASMAFAAAPKSYQVTGPVLEIADDMIIIKKGKDKWEIAKDKNTKVTGDLKVGAKVTISYRMSASDIEVKDKKTKKTKK